MSGTTYSDIDIPDNVIRNFLTTIINGGNYALDVPLTGIALGLDYIITNNGAAALTVSINGQGAVTVAAGATRGMTGVSFWLITIVSAVNYDLQIAGIRLATLKRRGLI